MKSNHPLRLQSPCSASLLAWASSDQMVSFHSSSLSWPTVFFWHSLPDWLLFIGLLSSGQSTSISHSTAIPHIVSDYSDPTGNHWCQLRVTSYTGDVSWCHSGSVSIENIVMFICAVLSHHCSCDNTRGWVVMMLSKDVYLAVIGVSLVLAYNWWTIYHRHLTSLSSDVSWPWKRDQSKLSNNRWLSHGACQELYSSAALANQACRPPGWLFSIHFGKLFGKRPSHCFL